jgi:GTP-binding protein
MLAYGHARGLSCHCLLTKADKLGRGAASATLLAVQKELGGRASAQLFSAHNGQGVEEARAVMSEWLRMDSAEALPPIVSKRTR